MNEWMNEWRDEWMNEWMNEWLDECQNVGTSTPGRTKRGTL